MRQVLVLVLKYNWLTRTVKLKDEFPHGFSHITVSFHSVKLCSTRIVKQVFYRPQRICGQCNIFTPVCHSFCSRGGGGVCLSACWDTTPPGADPPPSRHIPPPSRQITPPGKQTPAYGLRAAGTHPTGMHSCLKIKILTFAAKCCNGSPSSLYVKLPSNMPSVSLSLNSP